MLEFTLRLAPVEELLEMISAGLRITIKNFVLALWVVFTAASITLSQPSTAPKYKSQEVSEADGVPVLIKHLPAWEQVRARTKFATNTGELKLELGDRPILDLIDFSAGTEAVTAPYDAGKLLIIEYGSPQGSVDADTKFTTKLGEDEQAGSTVYRRIGNYNVFVFDTADTAAAGALIDQVKYEKNVQWLGDNPFRISPERAFVLTTSDMFLSTFLIVLIGMGFAIVGGIATGFIYFFVREQKRAGMPTFSDAGGMTRLNLDGFTSEIVPDRLLGD